METLIVVLITLAVFGIVFYLATWIIGWMALPDPAQLPVRIVVGVVFLLILLGMFTGHIPHPYPVWRH